VLTWAEAGCSVRAASVEAFNQFTTPMDFLIICRPANDAWLMFCYAPKEALAVQQQGQNRHATTLLQLLLHRLCRIIISSKMTCIMAVSRYLTALMQLIFLERRHRAYRW